MHIAVHPSHITFWSWFTNLQSVNRLSESSFLGWKDARETTKNKGFVLWLHACYLHRIYWLLVVQHIRDRNHHCLSLLHRSHKNARLIWRTTEEWADLIAKWARSTGHGNSVCTLYELCEGDETEQQPFHGLDPSLLLDALKHLQRNGKAELMGEEGVKFLCFWSDTLISSTWSFPACQFFLLFPDRFGVRCFRFYSLNCWMQRKKQSILF